MSFELVEKFVRLFSVEVCWHIFQPSAAENARLTRLDHPSRRNPFLSIIVKFYTLLLIFHRFFHPKESLGEFYTFCC